jgi:hypothetical protein
MGAYMKQSFSFILFLFLCSCATSKNDFKEANHTNSSATVVANLKVLVNGSQDDLQELGPGICQVTFLNNGEKIKYKLEKSGEVYLNAKPGTLSLRELNCFTGVFSESKYFFDQDLNKANLIAGKSNYVGDLILNWNLGESKFDLASFLLPGSGSYVNRYGDIDIAVVESDETMTKFSNKHKKVVSENVVTSLWKFQ